MSDLPSGDAPEPILLEAERIVEEEARKPFGTCRVCEPTVEVTDDQGVTVNAVRHETYCPFFR